MAINIDGSREPEGNGMGADTRRKNTAGHRYPIVTNTGKVTELIKHRGSLQSADEKALLYVAKGR